MRLRRAAVTFRDDTGATVLLVAMSFVVIIGLMALVVDVGLATMVRSRLQTAADSAALAGCEHLIQWPGFAGDAAAVSRDYVLRHASGPLSDLTVGDIEVTAEHVAGQPEVSVTINEDVPLAFGRLLGRNSTTITTRARAQGQALSGARYVAPFAVVVPQSFSDVRYEVRTTTGVVVASGALTQNVPGMTWSATITAPATPARYEVFITYVNAAGTTEYFYDTRLHRVTPACLLFTRGGAQPVSDVKTTGSLFVEMATPTTPAGAWPSVTATVSGVPGSVIAKTTSTTSGHALAMWPVRVGLEQVAILHPRRRNAPFKDVRVDPIVADPGASVQLTVELDSTDVTDASFTQAGSRVIYLRNADNAAYSGDVVELNYDTLSHTGCGAQPFSVAGLTGLNQASRVEYGYPAPVHVGDEVSLAPVVWGNGFNSYLWRGADGRKRAIAPVVIRLPSGRARVTGFVNFSIERADFGVDIAHLRCYGDYAATPHEFSPAPTPDPTTNDVLAARLVRP